MPDRLLYVMGEMTQSVRTVAHAMYVIMGIVALPVALLIHNLHQSLSGMGPVGRGASA